jgi:lysophospholipase L1-like esterase
MFAAAIIYVIFLHLFAGVLIFKTDFIQKVKINLGLMEESWPYFATMLMFHSWMDESIPDNSVVFLGDSITQGLATAAVTAYSTNYGISNQTTRQLLQALPVYKSLNRVSAIVLTIGINDFHHGLQEGINERLQQIIDAFPREKPLIWSAIMPSRAVQNTVEIIQANRAIKSLCEKRGNCVFVDTWRFLTDENGQMVQRYFLDGVHPSPEGYKLWISALKQAMQQIPSSDRTKQ